MSEWTGGEQDKARWEDHVHGLDFEQANRQRQQEREARLAARARAERRRRLLFFGSTLVILACLGAAGWHWRSQIQELLPVQEEEAPEPVAEQPPATQPQPQRTRHRPPSTKTIDMEAGLDAIERSLKLSEQIKAKTTLRDEYQARLDAHDAQLKQMEKRYQDAQRMQSRAERAESFRLGVLMTDLANQAKTVKTRRAYDQRMWDKVNDQIVALEAELSLLPLP